MKEYWMLHGALISPQDIMDIVKMRENETINVHGQRVIVDELWKQGKVLAETCGINK